MMDHAQGANLEKLAYSCQESRAPVLPSHCQSLNQSTNIIIINVHLLDKFSYIF